MSQNLVAIQTDGARHITTDIVYSLGGFSYATGKKEPRGYRVMVVPKTIEGNRETFGAYTGYKDTIKTVQRKSAKAYRESVRLCFEDEKDLVSRMITAVGIQEGLDDDQIEKVISKTMESLKDKYEELK